MRVGCISGVRLLVLSSMPAWLLGSLLVAAPSSAEASHNDPAAPVASSSADCVNGSGAEVALVRGVEIVAPVLGSVTVDGAGVVLVFDKALAGSSVPAADDFGVSVRDWETGAVAVRPVGEVSVDDNMVSLTLDAAVRSRDVVAVSYWGGSNPIRGSGGLDAATLDGCGAVNDTVEASDASLAVLELSGVELSPRFVPDITAYTASVDDSVTHVTVRASATDLRAWVFLGDSVDVDGDPHNGHQVALVAGVNTITATVTAEDSVTASTYTVTVTRAHETASETGEASLNSAVDGVTAGEHSVVIDRGATLAVDSVSVRPVRWSRFDGGVPAHHSAGEARGWLLTSLRYALNEWWFEFKDFDAQDSRPYLDFSDASHGGSASEQRYGESAAMAVALAVALQTGAYDESVTGVGADVARRRALKLVQSLAYRHHASAPARLQHDSWGNEARSVVWAAHVGYAAWLLWADLSPVVRRFVKRMIVGEAGEYRSPLYYRDRAGALDFTGSKAEYAARNAVLLSLAAAMMPEHADAGLWESQSVQFMLSAYSRPVDTSSSKIYHGHPLKDWLGGSNINSDGTATVRGVVHPDHMAAGVVEFNPVHIYHLAGQPTPQAAKFNADKVMQALVELELDTGSLTQNLSGPIFRAGTLCEGDGATECKTRAERAGEAFVGGHPRGCLAGPPGTDTNVSYPDGSGWSTKHRSSLAMLAAQADVYRFDTNIADDTLGGGYWFSCFVRDVRAMQARHLDGRTWNNSDNFNFAAREGQSAYHAAQSWIAYWIQHQLGIAGTRRLYANDPNQLEFRKITSIEAEDESNTLGGSLKTIACDNCSGGNAIALEGTGSDNALTIPNIQIDDSGIYRLYIIYSSNQDHNIALNLPRDGLHEPAEYPVSLPALHRHELGVAQTRIHLDAGDNDLTIFRPSPNSDETPPIDEAPASGGAPAIDRVILGPPDALSVAPTLTVAEGTSEDLPVTLLTEPTEPLKVTVHAPREGLSATPDALTFTTANWDTAQTIEVTADEDPDTNNDSHSVTLSYLWAGSYRGQSEVAVHVSDDDTYTLVAPTTLRIAQGSVASLRVRLSAQPSGDVAVTATASNTRIGATPAPLTFTPSDWRTYQTLEVWATDPGTATLTLTYSGGGADPGHTDVAVTVTETRQPRTGTSEPEPDPSDTTAPQLVSATVNGTQLTLTYRETLDTDSTPSETAFAVSVVDSATAAASTPAVSSVDVSGAEVTLTLATAVRNGDTVAVTYTVGDEANNEEVIQDTTGLNAAALSSEAVTNNTAAASDATLDVLALADAGGTAVALSPAFGSPEDTSGTYTASVANEVAAVTVTATTTDSRASLTLPTDADAGTAGVQVNLDVGDNTATLTVTAEDSSTTATYTVTVTRADETDPPAVDPSDTTAPSLASATVDGADLVLTYSEALDTGSEPAVSAFSVSVTDSVTSTTSTPAVSSVDVTGADVVLTLGAAVRNNDTVTVSYTVPDEANGEAVIEDLAGLNAAALASQSVTNATAEAADATLSALAVSAGADAVALTPVFDAAESTYSASVVNEVTSVTVTAAATDSRASVALPTDDDTVTGGVQVDLDVGANTVTVTVTAEDGSTTGAYTVTVSRADETDPPQLTSATVDGAELVLTYSETLDSSSKPATSAFAVSVTDSVTSTTSTPTVSTVDVSGAEVTLTLAAGVHNGDTVTVSYTVGDETNNEAVIQDTAGLNAAALSSQAVTNNTDAASDATLQALGLTDLGGTAVALTPAFEATKTTYAASVANEVAVVTVTATGTDDRAAVVVAPADSDTDTDHHQAALAAALTEASDTTVTVTVTAEDSFTTGTYTITVTRAADTTAPSLSTATVDGADLVLAYSEALDTGSEPAVSAFSVSVTDSVTATTSTPAVSDVEVTGVEVTLTLGAAVRFGDTVTVSYTVPDEANGEAVIEDLAGLNAAALASQSVTNATAEAADATLSALAVAVGGTALTLTPVFDAGESTYSASVTHEVTAVTVAATTTDSRASVALPADDDSLTEGVQVDLDVGANTVAVTVTAEDNTTGAYTVTVSRADETDPPQLSTAAVDAADLVLVYSESLDAGSKPATGDFAVTVVDSATSAEAAVAVTAVDVDGSDVELTLAAAVRHGDTVTFDYTPGTDPIKDAAANPAAALDDQAVTNTTAAASDATLQTLALADAAGTTVALSPTFGSPEDTTGTYTAQVANEVAAVTVTATGADDRAGVVVSPADADTDTAHHQAALAAALTEASDTTVTVTVTAEDTTTTGTYTITVTRAPDTTAPSLASATVDGTGLTLTYSEALDTGSEPATSAFSVSVTDSVTSATSTPAVSDVDVTGADVVLTLGAAVRFGDTVAVSYTVPDEANSEAVIQDLAGLNAAALASQSVTNATAKAADATLAALAVAVGETALTLTPAFEAAETSYSASVAHETTVATVTAAVTDSRASVALPDDDDSVTDGVQVNLTVGANTVTVTVTAEDGSTTGAYTVTVSRADETDPPQLTTAAVDAADLVLTYSETLDSSSKPATSAFAVSVTDSVTSTTSTPAVSTVDVSGAEVTLTLAAGVRNGDTVTVSYTVGDETNGEAVIQDTAGLNAAALSSQAVTNNTAAAADATLQTLALADAAGTAVALSPVFGSVQDTTGTYTASVANEVAVVTVTATGADDRAGVVVSPADADADTEGVQVELAAALTEASDTTITVTVTAEDTTTTGTYTVTVTRAPDTTAPSLSTATIDGTELTLTYSETLDTASEPAVGAFSVSVTDSVTSATSTPAVSDVDVTGAEVVLTLAAAVRNNDTVAVSYTVPDEANSEAVIEDLAGLNAAALSSQSVTNNTANQQHRSRCRRHPSNIGSGRRGGTAVALSPTFGSVQDTTSTYTASVANEVAAVTVTATGADTRARRGDRTRRLRHDTEHHQAALAAALTEASDTTVTVTVTAEDTTTTGTYTITVTRAPDTTAPSLASATVNGADLVLAYSETLDSGSEPAVSAFSVSVKPPTRRCRRWRWLWAGRRCRFHRRSTRPRPPTARRSLTRRPR